MLLKKILYCSYRKLCLYSTLKWNIVSKFETGINVLNPIVTGFIISSNDFIVKMFFVIYNVGSWTSSGTSQWTRRYRESSQDIRNYSDQTSTLYSGHHVAYSRAVCISSADRWAVAWKHFLFYGYTESYWHPSSVHVASVVFKLHLIKFCLFFALRWSTWGSNAFVYAFSEACLLAVAPWKYLNDRLILLNYVL